MIKENILEVRERVAGACAKSNRGPKEITIVAASKGRSPEEIQEVIAAGINDIGENRVQEALLKCRQLSAVKWHMVGHLQTNKVKDAVKIFDLIHSVDSEDLALEIDKQAAKINKAQDILIQVNISGEESKFGLRPEQAIEAILKIRTLKNVAVKGLMTIVPLVDNPEKVRLYFRALRELRDKIYSLKLTAYNLQLSMGMSDDFEVAIEEGADIVRIGRAIYE
jgi:pyridoxal phosphate enzyme (YggS family)